MWQFGGKLVKRGQLLLLLLIALVALYSPASWADGTNPPVDPKPITQGCGGTNPPCDYTVIGPSGEVSISLTFEPVKGDYVVVNGVQEQVYEAVEDFVNESGHTITGFTASFNVPSGLVFEGCGSTQLGTCTPDFEGNVTSGVATYTFGGLDLPSYDPDDCEGVIGLVLGLISIPGTDVVMSGETVTGTLSVPEPSSALLLLFGLAAGLVGFRSRRKSPA